ncbi:MAG TPA: hypothetical protein DCS91_10595 [Microcoleaceae bacterium UBA11344]|nr:hypothetical protein [Microcoleaceae cyanobacterium UBA11344]
MISQQLCTVIFSKSIGQPIRVKLILTELAQTNSSIGYRQEGLFFLLASIQSSKLLLVWREE